jgi:hypothetical protein
MPALTIEVVNIRLPLAGNGSALTTASQSLPPFPSVSALYPQQMPRCNADALTCPANVPNIWQAEEYYGGHFRSWRKA